MRVAVLSDIHGNLPALQAVYDDLTSRAAEQIIVLGDVAFKGPHPQECLAFLQDLQPVAMIQGNTDQWLVEGLPGRFTDGDEQGRRMLDFFHWTRERLGTQLQALADLPFSYEAALGEEIVLYLHATPESNETWVPLSAPDEELERHFQHPRAHVFVAGHVHTPGLRRLADQRTVINVGSVGMPWDGDCRASYAILEGDGRRIAVNLIRVPYNIERTIQDARDCGMPWAQEYEQALRSAQPF